MTLYFSPSHQWLRLDTATTATVGITAYAQDTLGDVVFVDLPAPGRHLARDEVAGAVESVKTAADVYSPVSGEVLHVNETLRADPSLVNSDPMLAGWFFKIKLADASQVASLLDEASYLTLISSP
ncbi:MAG: glycine cleavage system protein GcvH [Burkholderiales bacterium]